MIDGAKLIRQQIHKRLAENLSPLPIIYEDNHLLVIEKYPFVLSQPDGSQKLDVISLFKDYIRQRSLSSDKPKIGNIYLSAVHRLDYTVGGILLLAKTSKASTRLSANWQARLVNKCYLLVAEESGKSTFQEAVTYVLEDYLYKQEKAKKAVIYPLTAAVKTLPQPLKIAKLSFRILKKEQRVCLCAVNLESGRFHQIRAQMAYHALPLLGDYKYNKAYTAGAKQSGAAAFFAPLLWSYNLTFKHPTTQTQLNFYSWPPALLFKEYADYDFADLLQIRQEINHDRG